MKTVVSFRDVEMWQPFRLDPLGPYWLKSGPERAILAGNVAEQRTLRPFEKVHPLAAEDCIREDAHAQQGRQGQA